MGWLGSLSLSPSLSLSLSLSLTLSMHCDYIPTKMQCACFQQKSASLLTQTVKNVPVLLNGWSKSKTPNNEKDFSSTRSRPRWIRLQKAWAAILSIHHMVSEVDTVYICHHRMNAQMGDPRPRHKTMKKRFKACGQSKLAGDKRHELPLDVHVASMPWLHWLRQVNLATRTISKAHWTLVSIPEKTMLQFSKSLVKFYFRHFRWSMVSPK